MLDPSRSRIVLGELPLGFPHSGAVVVEDYRPARRCPLVYRQYIISRHHAFSFRYGPRTAGRAITSLQHALPPILAFPTHAQPRPFTPRPCTFTSLLHFERNGAQHPSQGSLAQADI